MVFAPHPGYWLRRIASELASGNPLYVPRRVGYALRKRVVDGMFSFVHSGVGRQYLDPAVSDDAAGLMRHFRSRARPAFHFRTEDIDELVSRIPAETKARTIEAAEDVIQHRFTFRGLKPICLDPMDWHFAPEENTGWRRHLNRHFYFAQLGFAYWYAKDVRFAQTFFDLSSSWIEQHGNRLGKLTWDDPFEVAARINAWIWAYFLFLDCPQWTADRHAQFLKALAKLSEYLFQVIEYHRPGNHILLEAKALALCSGLFPEFRGSQRWAAKAWRILERELRSQICSDGVHAERSTMYHRIVAGELTELALFCRHNNLSEADNLAAVVGKMADFEDCITTEDGSVPLFGDAYLTDIYIRFSAPTILEALTKREVAPLSLVGQADHNHWALGRQREESTGISLPVSLGKRGSKDFAEGGYFVSRSSTKEPTSVLVWDCGPLGYKTNLYHSHSDTLSFFLAIRGVPVFVDPGTDEFLAEKRRYLCGTSAHNTLQIDAEDQSSRTEDNRICTPARANLIFWGTLPECDVMIGSHNGYETLPDPSRHTRTIISVKDQYWLIFDRVEGQSSHKLEQRFHLAPGSSVTWTHDRQRLIIEKCEVRLVFAPIPFLIDRDSGSDPRTEIESGYAELECGRIEPIPVINTVRTGPVPYSVGALLCPLDSGSKDVSVRLLDTLDSSGFQGAQIEAAGFRDKVFFRVGAARKKYEFVDGWETDARVVILRHDTSGVVASAFVADASTFVHDSFEYLGPGDSACFRKILF